MRVKCDQILTVNRLQPKLVYVTWSDCAATKSNDSQMEKRDN